MAEAVGAVASVLQLIKYTLKTLSLVSRLKDVPTTVHGLTTQAKQLEDVVTIIQRCASLDLNRNPLQAILRDCESDLASFERCLQVLGQDLDGKAIEKG